MKKKPIEAQIALLNKGLRQSARLEHIDKKKNISKFWEFQVHGGGVIISYGRIGTFPKTHWPNYTWDQVMKKAEQKIKKGYRLTRKKVKWI